MLVPWFWCRHCWGRLPHISTVAGRNSSSRSLAQVWESNLWPQQRSCAFGSSICPLCWWTRRMSCTVSRYPRLIYLKLITYSTYAAASRFKKRWPSWPPAASTQPLSLSALVKVLSVKHLQTFSLCNLGIAGSGSLYTKLSPLSRVGGFSSSSVTWVALRPWDLSS